jgi:tyrosinase
MQSNEITVGSGGSRITLAPLPEAQARSLLPQGAPTPPPTLVLKHVQLLSRPPAPLHVFLNLPEGTAPALNSPYHVGMLNFFNWDTSTGGPMTETLGRRGQVEEAMPSTGVARTRPEDRIFSGPC